MAESITYICFFYTQHVGITLSTDYSNLSSLERQQKASQLWKSLDPVQARKKIEKLKNYI